MSGHECYVVFSAPCSVRAVMPVTEQHRDGIAEIVADAIRVGHIVHNVPYGDVMRCIAANIWHFETATEREAQDE